MISSIGKADALRSKQDERNDRKLANISKSLTAIKKEDDVSQFSKLGPKNSD